MSFKYLLLLILSGTFHNAISSSIADGFRGFTLQLHALCITSRGLDRAFENQDRELLDAVQKLRPKTMLTAANESRLLTEIEMGRSTNIDWILSKYKSNNRSALRKAIEKQNFYAIAAILNLQPDLICDTYDFYHGEVHKEIVRCVPYIAKALLDKFHHIRSIKTKVFLNKILENEVKKDAKDQSIKILELFSNLMLHKKYIPEGTNISQNEFLARKLRESNYSLKSHLAFALPLSCIDLEDMDEHIKNLVENGLARHSHVVDELLTLEHIPKSRKSVDALLSNGALDNEDLFKLLNHLLKIENCHDILDRHFEIFLKNEELHKLNKILTLYNMGVIPDTSDLHMQIMKAYSDYKLIKEKIDRLTKEKFVRPPVEKSIPKFFRIYIDNDYKNIPICYKNPIALKSFIDCLNKLTASLESRLVDYERDLCSCSICYTSNPKFVACCPNNHAICTECIFNLRSEICPFCRENIYKRFSTCMTCNKEENDCKLLTCEYCNKSSILCLSCIMQGVKKYCCNKPFRLDDYYNIKDIFEKLIEIFIEKNALIKANLIKEYSRTKIKINLDLGLAEAKRKALNELGQLYSLLRNDVNYTRIMTTPTETLTIDKHNLFKLVDIIFG